VRTTHEALPSRGGRCRDILAVGSGDLKTSDRTAAAGGQGRPGVVEPDPDRGAFAREVAVPRAAAMVLREQRQTAADVLLVGWMDIRRVADVVDDCNAGVAK